MTPYVIIPLQLINNINQWIKIIIPLDSHKLLDKPTIWLWDTISQDAYPENFKYIPEYGFRTLANLYGPIEIINAETYDLRLCQKEQENIIPDLNYYLYKA
jgi:hypothetical protein